MELNFTIRNILSRSSLYTSRQYKDAEKLSKVAQVSKFAPVEVTIVMCFCLFTFANALDTGNYQLVYHYAPFESTGSSDIFHGVDLFFQLKYVVMINCGNNMDILEVLQPEEDVQFFICDSHRPIDLFNVYNDTQVRKHDEPILHHNWRLSSSDLHSTFRLT